VSAPPVSLQVINLVGRAQRPLCHFELPPSDYLERRPAGLPDLTSQIGAVETSLRVIEFQSLGVRVKNTFRFGVINPTNASYEFGWEPVGTPNPCFRCGSAAGIILGGKRQEMVFEFTPATTEPAEAYYRFSIPSQNITAVFLLAGVVVEPKVCVLFGGWRGVGANLFPPPPLPHSCGSLGLSEPP
jgi:hydrocephalus-inducing protein